MPTVPRSRTSETAQATLPRWSDTAARSLERSMRGFVVVVALLGSVGCTSLLSPISSVPANRLPRELLAAPRASLLPIDIARLRQDTPSEYRLDSGDVLAVYVEGVLGKDNESPPFHFPERGSDVEPAIGYPIPIRDDGHVSLPLIEPLPVRGLTVKAAEDRIRDAYLTKGQVLRPDRDRILVSLIRRRTHRVIVIREDGIRENAIPGGSGGRVTSGSAQAGRGFVLDLPAYKNDVLHALAESGGLPGLNAKNEVKILRSKSTEWELRDALVREFYEAYAYNPCACPMPPDDPAAVRIPLRLPPGQTPQFEPRDVILNDGDIVCVESRDTEVFYTGGLLTAGQFPLPRDYDLDVLGAIAVAGSGLGATTRGGFISGLGGASPSQLYVIRRLPGGRQVTIGVDLNRAITDPKERLLVQSGDTLILRHTPVEETTNFGLATFFTYGVSQLFSN